MKKKKKFRKHNIFARRLSREERLSFGGDINFNEIIYMILSKSKAELVKLILCLMIL